MPFLDYEHENVLLYSYSTYRVLKKTETHCEDLVEIRDLLRYTKQ